VKLPLFINPFFSFLFTRKSLNDVKKGEFLERPVTFYIKKYNNPTDLSVSLLFSPNGDEDASAHSQDPRQFPQRPHSPVSRRQVTFDTTNEKWHKLMIISFFSRWTTKAGWGWCGL
jgi:phosphoribosyl 1,2-cyclic phosphodiesterase